jgi:hypothetical protein
VTIVVPRKAAEDFYYAIAMALGSRPGFGAGYYGEWAPGKKGMTPQGKGELGVPLPDPKPEG